MQPVQDLTIEDRVSRTQYQFTLEDAERRRARARGCRSSSSACARLPQLADVASDLQDRGLQAYVEIDRATASRLGITPAAIDNALYNAFGQRLDLDDLHAVEPVPRGARGEARVPARARRARTTSTSRRPCRASRRSRCRCRRSRRVVEQPAPLAINHIGQFPAATISFNLAPRRVARRGGRRRSRRRERELGLPASVHDQLPGRGARVPRVARQHSCC